MSRSRISAAMSPAASVFPTPASPRDSSALNCRFAGKHIHFIGIGGCGISGLALMLKQLGAVCGGSDAVGSELTDALDAAGIPVRLDQSSGTIPEKCDLIIVS